MPIITPASRNGWSFSADSALSMLDLQELDANTSYSWTVETRYAGPTETKGSRVLVSFVGSRKGSRTYAWRHALTASQNHLAAAVEWLQQLSSLNGSPSYALVAKASTTNGYVFTFC
jgi:hypothetical protein